MKKLQEKLALLLVILKGKKPVVVVISLVVIGLCLLGVNYGYITEDVLNFNLIVESVDGWFKTTSVDTLTPVVDTLTNVVDTSVVVIDTLVK